MRHRRACARRAAIALDTGWRSVPDPGNVGLRDGWARGLPASAGSVAIPNDFNPNVSPAGDRGTVVWYALRFDGPPAVAGRSWNVRFEQVRRTAEVWLNGRRIGASAEPYAPFSVPAASLRSGAPNLLVVRVSNVAGPRLVSPGLVELGRDRPRRVACSRWAGWRSRTSA